MALIFGVIVEMTKHYPILLHIYTHTLIGTLLITFLILTN